MTAFILYLSNFIIYTLIIIRLIVTNHWTTGKKIIVGLVGSIIWYQGVESYLLVVYGLTCSFNTILLYSLPLTLMGIITCLAIYRKQLE